MLAQELQLEVSDPPILVVVGLAGAGFEGGGGVLEELFLPAIEHRGMDAVLVTEIGDGRVLQEMESKEATFSWAVKRLRVFLGMEGPPLEVVAYSSRRVVPFQLRQNSCGSSEWIEGLAREGVQEYNACVNHAKSPLQSSGGSLKSRTVSRLVRRCRSTFLNRSLTLPSLLLDGISSWP